MINYDLPNNRELYIHRIGRSGRFGRKVCYSLFYILATDNFFSKDTPHYLMIMSCVYTSELFSNFVPVPYVHNSIIIHNLSIKLHPSLHLVGLQE